MSLYLNLVRVAMTLFATHYIAPDSERASHEDSEYMVLFNGSWYSKIRKFRFQGSVNIYMHAPNN